MTNKRLSFSLLSLAVLLFSASIFLLQHDSSEAFTPGNTAPVINSYAIRTGNTTTSPIASPVTLTAGATTEFYLVASVTDVNGASTIGVNDVSFYRTTVGMNCSDPGNASCYDPEPANDCGKVVDAKDPTKATIVCNFTLNSNTDSTDTTGVYPSDNWTAYLRISDGVAFATRSDFTTEVASLLASKAVNYPAAYIPLTSMDYGTLSVNTASTSSYVTNHVNIGNVPINYSIYSSGMSCTSGSIPASAQKFDVSDKFYGFMQFTMPSTPQAFFTIGVVGDAEEGGDDENVIIYSRILVPEGVGGSCSGTNYYVASIAN